MRLGSIVNLDFGWLALIGAILAAHAVDVLTFVIFLSPRPTALTIESNPAMRALLDAAGVPAVVAVKVAGVVALGVLLSAVHARYRRVAVATASLALAAGLFGALTNVAGLQLGIGR